jgi:hypothetical protein
LRCGRVHQSRRNAGRQNHQATERAQDRRHTLRHQETASEIRGAIGGKPDRHAGGIRAEQSFRPGRRNRRSIAACRQSSPVRRPTGCAPLRPPGGSLTPLRSQESKEALTKEGL